MRVYDCFPFFNELDVLEIRLHEHAASVDRFVIAESTTTFAGDPKPLFFLENKSRFADFADKIAHIVVREVPARFASRWGREQYQRDVLMQGLGEANPEDLVILSDVDEILRQDTIRAAADHSPSLEVLCFELRMFNYFLNYERDQSWLRSGPRAVRRSGLETLWGLRNVRPPRSVADIPRRVHNWRAMGRRTSTRTAANAGWHFTYLGDANDIDEKIRARTRSPPGVPTEPGMEFRARISALPGSGALSDTGRHLQYVPLDRTFPEYLLQNRARFARYILDAAPLRG